MAHKNKPSDWGKFTNPYTKKEVKIKFPIRLGELVAEKGEVVDVIINDQEGLDRLIIKIKEMEKEGDRKEKNVMLKNFLYMVFETEILNMMEDLNLVKHTGDKKLYQRKKELHRGKILMENLLHHISIAYTYRQFYMEGHMKRMLLEMGRMLDPLEDITIQRNDYELIKTTEDVWVFGLKDEARERLG